MGSKEKLWQIGWEDFVIWWDWQHEGHWKGWVMKYSWKSQIVDVPVCVCALNCPVTYSSLWPHGLMSIESVILSNDLTLRCPLLLLLSFSASASFRTSWLFVSGGQNVGASASVLPMNIQDWFPLERTGLILLQFKGLSRVFFSTIVWRHQFFGAQPSFWSNSPIHTWLLEKP